MSVVCGRIDLSVSGRVVPKGCPVRIRVSPLASVRSGDLDASNARMRGGLKRACSDRAFPLSLFAIGLGPLMANSL